MCLFRIRLSCLERQKKMVTVEDIEAAQKNIASYAKQTPLTRSKFLSELCKGEIFLKWESQQPTRSFKVRGVTNKLLSLSPEEKARGIMTASAGNHGQAVAYVAQKLGFKAKIVVPAHAPQVKVDGIRQFGAELVLFGDTYDEAEKKAKELAAEEGKLYISPYNDEELWLGTGQRGWKSSKNCRALTWLLFPWGEAA